ncbi:transporter substrate-binding domain-containing protein, partial [Lysinibacillus sp. D4A3_S15]|uniref:transporter substrate-binding domain-containing protein n=1 Tax=Lysinibacillus sp. D4A3_S15 TaxID=2941227 RepID=UPI0020BDBFDA
CYMKKNKIFQFAAIGLASIALLAGCNSGESADKNSDEGREVRTVKVAYDQASKPISYIDDDGNPTGYDVEVMKLLDEVLPD